MLDGQALASRLDGPEWSDGSFMQVKLVEEQCTNCQRLKNILGRIRDLQVRVLTFTCVQ